MVGRIVNGDLEPPERQGSENSLGADEFSGFTCPECRGPLYRKKKAGPIEFRCRVGHVISLETLIDESSSTQERKLYEAIVALEEGADLAAISAGRVEGEERNSFLRESQQLKEYASAIRAMIEQREEPRLP